MKIILVLFTSVFFVLFFSQEKVPADKPNSKVSLYLIQVAGVSPRVFTEGWVFGAKGILEKGSENEKDISESIRWSGTGTFTPSTGSTTRPVFDKEGLNEITMTYDYQGISYSETFKVYAVSNAEYANTDDYAIIGADSHGCPACPHKCVGRFDTYSPTVKVRGLPAIRKGDKGTHVSCCGENIFEAVEGDPSVLVDGKPAARKGDKTKHCGGYGMISNNTPETADLNIEFAEYQIIQVWLVSDCNRVQDETGEEKPVPWQLPYCGNTIVPPYTVSIHNSNPKFFIKFNCTQDNNEKIELVGIGKVFLNKDGNTQCDLSFTGRRIDSKEGYSVVANVELSGICKKERLMYDDTRGVDVYTFTLNVIDGTLESKNSTYADTRFNYYCKITSGEMKLMYPSPATVNNMFK